MLNLEWKDYSKVSEEENYLKEKGERVCNVLKEIFSKNNTPYCKQLARINKNLATLANCGDFMYLNGDITQCLKRGTHIDYYHNGKYVAESTFAVTKQTSPNKFKTDLIPYATSFLTNKKIYVYKKGDKFFVDYNNQELIDNFIDDNRGRYIINNNVENFDKFLKREGHHRYGCYYYEDTLFKDEIIENLYSNFSKTDEKIHNFNNNKIVFSKEHFYYNINDKFFKIDTFENNELYYCLIENVLYYVFKKENGYFTDIKQILVYSEYTQIIQNNHYLNDTYFVRFVDNKLNFEKKLYSKYMNHYIIKDKEYLVFKDTVIEINDDFAKFENGEMISNSSNLPILKSNDGLYSMRIKNIFFLADDENLYVFYKECNNIIAPCFTGLEKFKRLKYKRHNTNFLLSENKDRLYYSDDDNYCNYLDLKEFKLNTIKAIDENHIFIEGLDNKPYVLSSYCLFNLLIPKEKVIYIHSCYEDNLFVLGKLEANNYIIQIDNYVFKLINNKLYYGEDLICNNIYLENEKSYNLLLKENSILKDLAPWYTISLRGCSILSGSFETHITYKERKNFLLCSVNWNDYYILSKKDNIYTNINREFFSNIRKLEKNDLIILQDSFDSQYGDFNSSNSHKKIVKTIINGWCVENTVLNRYFRNENLWNNVIERISTKDFSTKKSLEKELKTSIVMSIKNEFNLYGINITTQSILNYFTNINFIDLVVSIENLKKNTDNKSFESLLVEFNNFFNHTNFKNDYMKELNKKNLESCLDCGIDINKFNSFDYVKTFSANVTKAFTQKDSLQETIINQLRLLIGSRKNNIEGFLTLSKLENISVLYNLMFNDNLSGTFTDCNDESQKIIFRETHKISFKIFKLLKSYRADIHYLDKIIYIDNKKFTDIPIEKLVKFSHLLVNILENAKNSLDNKIINSNVFIKMLDWCSRHISEECNNISIDSEIDKSSKELTLKLWDRKDVLTNIAQGSRTHCCISLDSYNIGSLVDYILNKNIVLVEIRHNNKVVGQAFVYLAISNDKMMYNYQIKKHKFLIIDNVEVNNKYKIYSNSIAVELQQFMLKFLQYLGNISDVLLGTNYNDIPTPYNRCYKSTIEVSIIGNDLYRDSERTFYKFI